MIINDIPLGRLKEILASDTPLAVDTTEALIARLESSGMMLNIMRRQRDGYQAQARKAEQAVARVREVLEHHTFVADDKYGDLAASQYYGDSELEAVAAKSITRALDGEPNEV